MRASGIVAELDDLEARLEENRRWVELHRVLADRHARVSALACVNAVEHARALEMAERRARRRTALAASDRLHRRSTGSP